MSTGGFRVLHPDRQRRALSAVGLHGLHCFLQHQRRCCCPDRPEDSAASEHAVHQTLFIRPRRRLLGRSCITSEPPSGLWDARILCAGTSGLTVEKSDRGVSRLLKIASRESSDDTGHAQHPQGDGETTLRNHGATRWPAPRRYGITNCPSCNQDLSPPAAGIRMIVANPESLSRMVCTSCGSRLPS